MSENGKVIDLANLPPFLRHTKPPSDEVPGAPLNFGKDALPHAETFMGLLSSMARVYRPSDVALQVSRENARFMRNDLVIRECIDQRQRSVCLLNWHLEPDDEKDPRQRELADELKAIIESIPRFMQYRECLQDAIWYGRAAVQHTWGWKWIRGKKRHAITKWLPIHGDKLVFRYDDGTGRYEPDQVGIRVGPRLGHDRIAQEWARKVHPTDWGLAYFLDPWERPLIAIHKHRIEDGEWEEPRNAGRIHGVGIRSVIYWTWYQKQEALAWMMEYIERSAFGVEIWYYPWGNDQARKATAEAAKQRIGQGRNIVMVPKPVGEEGMAYGVERIEPGMAGVDACKDIISNYFGHLIKRYILGQTLTSEAENTGLGSNTAAIHLDTYMQIVQYDATNLEETLTTELVEPLKRFNFPQYANCPVHFRIDTREADAESKLNAWAKAYEMGKEIPAKDVGDLLGIREPDEDEKVLLHPAFRQQAGMGAGQDGTPPVDIAEQMALQAAGHLRTRETMVDQASHALGLHNPADSDRVRL